MSVQRQSWLSACCLAATVAVLPSPAPETQGRVYTNADLERVRPLRYQTGAQSTPVERADESDESGSEKPRDLKAEERHWRREADRHRERLRPLRAKVDDLRAKIEERWREPGVAPLSDPQIARWRSVLEDLEQRLRETERRFAERARRARAFPGWLR